MITDEVQAQRDYYTRTADRYDELHVVGETEHDFALAWMKSLLGLHDFKSVLDVGSGTGRVVGSLRQSRPDILTLGVEPVKALREMSIRNGLSADAILDGDATRLAFPDASFDMVCSFGVLHHIRKPSLAVAEMLRVADRAVFISDVNRFGQGRPMVRWLKRGMAACGLWKLTDWIKTRGKGYIYSEEDGISYSYSIFDDFSRINAACSSIHLMNLDGGGTNMVTGASHVALFGVLKRPHSRC